MVVNKTESFYVVESGGDGAQAVVVHGWTAMIAEVTRQMWAGDDEPSDDVKADIAQLANDDNWTSYYPTNEQHACKLDFEDGYVRVLRLTEAPRAAVA